MTANGDYILAGVTGNNGLDAWIAKLESDGDIEWERKFGGADNEELYSIKQLSDETYVAAGYTCAPVGQPCKGLVTRLDQDGTILWLKNYDDTEGYGRIHTLEQPTGNELVCTGYSLGADYGAIWLLRLDLDGAVLGSTSYDYNTAFPSGSITLATIDGRLIVGRVGFIAAVIKLNSSGAIQWQKMYTPVIDGGPWQYSFFYAVAQDGNNFILAGQINGVPDPFIWVMKIDSNGAVIWSKVHRIVPPQGFDYTDSQVRNGFVFKGINPKGYVPSDELYYDKATSVHVTSGGIVVSGYLNNFDCGGWDFFVAQLDSNGNSCFFSEATTDVEIQSLSFNIASQPVSVSAGPSEFTSSTSVTIPSGSTANACSGLNLMVQCVNHSVNFDFPLVGSDKKVLIHNYGSVSYPEPTYQTQDRRIKIKATVRDQFGQPVDGHIVYFTVKDPPDSAGYVQTRPVETI